MIRITKIADYGILLLAQFAEDHQGVYHNARRLADRTQIPLPMVSKILKALAREGLLVSHRGQKGGYTLSRSADEITVAEIITALEGPIALTECADHETSMCDIESVCSVSSPWKRINEAVRKALDEITLSEMAAPACCGGAEKRPGFGAGEALMPKVLN